MALSGSGSTGQLGGDPDAGASVVVQGPRASVPDAQRALARVGDVTASDPGDLGGPRLRPMSRLDDDELADAAP
jgi:hypothetical protein